MPRIIVSDYEELSRTAAQFAAGVVRTKPDSVLVLATGETPVGAYRELAAMRQRGEIDCSEVRVFQLDAYLGIAPDDPRSLYGWLKRAFLDPMGIPDSHVTRLPGDTSDPDRTCEEFDAAVERAGGFDLALLGLGPNGHLGFNEPPAGPNTSTRVVTLTDSSLDSNARYWGGRDRVPRQAMTAGMAQLLAAKQSLLLVSGAHKHEILQRAVVGPMTPDVPGSYLQQADSVTILADRAAWDGPTGQ